jgi:hypothetical protein
MTAQEALKRNEKAQGLKVWQVDDTWFYVESEDGKIAYKCCISDHGDYCSCGDFATRGKNDPQFKCKHLLAVMNSIPRNEILEAQFLEKRKPKLDERFIKSIDGKDFALYSGLLDLAHQKNLTSMEVDLLQYPTKENEHTAVCRATGKTACGGVFIDVGDANPINCNAKVAKHIIRMASTRAKARCLRDLTNIGMTCLEELGDLTEVIGAENEAGRAVQPPKKDNVKKFPARQAQAAKPAHPGNGDGRKQENENQIPNQGKAEMAVQGNTPALPPAEVPAGKAEAERADTKPEKAPKVSAKETKTPVKAKSGNGNGNGKDKPEKIPMMSEAQKSAIYNLSRRRGISVEELENMAQKTFTMPVENLTHENAVIFIRTLQQAA